MLFQHQSIITETEKDEPSWLLGQSPGPYINQVSRSVFVSLGKRMSLLGLDCRTERMRDEILSQETYDTVFDRCRREIIKGETKHLLVLLGVPIAYPRLNFLENILTSRVMDPIKALGRTGMLGGFVNKFDGGVEILDDLDDHWTAKHHKAERNWFIQELQELAKEKSVRVTILGGDVHLAAVGRFFSKAEIGISRDRDWRYMPNVISSAIVNTPPPSVMADVLNKRDKLHMLDGETAENMIPLFQSDVDGSKRNNNCMLPRRNFCVVGEYIPGHTPPSSPGIGGDASAETIREEKRKFPPGSMKRSMSLTRGPVNLVRRLSGSSKRRPSISRPSMDENQGRPVFDGIQRANSLGSHPPDGYGFPPRHVPPPSMAPSSAKNSMQMERRPSYHRRPTDLTDKAARKAAARIGEDGNLDGRAPGEISLEGGLDVCLCVERDQKDPRGETVGYRLLVPALWYEPGAPNGAGELKRFSSHRKSLLERLKFNRKREEKTIGGEEYAAESESGSERDEEDERLPQPQATRQLEQPQQSQVAHHQPLAQGPPQWTQDQVNSGELLYAQQPQQSQSQQRPQSQGQYKLYPSTTAMPQSRYAQPQQQTQQYFQQPAQNPQSTKQRSSRDGFSAANSMGLSSTGRGAMTALPKRTVSGSAGYAAEPTNVATRSVSAKQQAPRASMDGYTRPSHLQNGHGEDAYAKGFQGGGPPIGGAMSSQQPGGGGRNGEYPASGYRRVSGSQPQQQGYAQQQQYPVQAQQQYQQERNGDYHQQSRNGDHHVLAPQPNGRAYQEPQRMQQPERRNTGNGLPLSSVPRDGEMMHEEDDDGYSSFDSEEEYERRQQQQQRGGGERRGSAAKAGKFLGIGRDEDGEDRDGGEGKKKKGWMIWK